jgi:hypothetical protein
MPHCLLGGAGVIFGVRLEGKVTTCLSEVASAVGRGKKEMEDDYKRRVLKGAWRPIWFVISNLAQSSPDSRFRRRRGRVSKFDLIVIPLG